MVMRMMGPMTAPLMTQPITRGVLTGISSFKTPMPFLRVAMIVLTITARKVPMIFLR